jgi:YesN/AraC family two-component response regulator
MIAEDEPLERAALRKIVESTFEEITLTEDAKTGEEAVLNAVLFRPDILLLDIKMPEKNGLDAQKEIIKLLPGVQTIIISAYTDFYYAHEAIKCKVADYLLKPVTPHTLREAINKILQGFSAEAGDAERSKPEEAAATGEYTMDRVIEYINGHFVHPLRLKDMAGMAYMNEQYFCRCFKEKTGTTFVKYVNRLKIKHAKTMLASTNVPVYRIASDMGFSDTAYFSKVFFQYENVTPLKFRRQAAEAIRA